MKRSGIRETTPKIPNNHLSVVDQMEKGYFVSPIMGNRIFAPIYRNDKPKYLLSDHPESRSNPDSLKYSPDSASLHPGYSLIAPAHNGSYRQTFWCALRHREQSGERF
jgi:hypothetical protein